jgi:predicted ATPase
VDDSRFITRVRLKNYRSIERCDVPLEALTFLVGPNGAGKSNFVDALRLVGDALRTSLDHAMRERGGVKQVRRRSSGHPTHFGIRVDVRLRDGQIGFYAFEVGARPQGDFVVSHEKCVLGGHRYEIREGVVTIAPTEVAPPAAPDRLYLVNAAGLPAFRPLYDALSSMGFYSLSPEQMRALQPPDKGDLLARDGRNVASVLERLQSMHPAAKSRIEEYLGRIVPGMAGVEASRVAHLETVEFRQAVEGAAHPWVFPANNMSDGTLRALGILVALFQGAGDGGSRLIAIEEPEVALHPAAAGILRDCLRDASRHVQVVVTSHSPDLLDDSEIPSGSLLAVSAEAGTSTIGPIDDAARSALIEHLYTPGELLRANQLSVEPSTVPGRSQLHLFAEDDAA